MIQGIGIDCVELARIKEIIETRPSFVKRILTENEREVFLALGTRRQIEYLGGRFACKEAFSKAMQTGIGRVSFHDVEILNNEQGAPVVHQTLFSGNVFVSITHTQDLAMAQIILENEK